ncbi:MAG: hypothetical protein Q7R91_00085 [bacterium]|nr:hypothetical protein [bacterium]
MTEEKRPEFKIDVEQDGIIHLLLSGHISSENLQGLRTWAEDVKKVVRETHEKTGRKALVVTDISKLENYHPEALSILAQMLKDNEPHVDKSATFGGGYFITVAQDIVTALSGRENFKGFKTEEEALNWLRE